LEKISHFGNVPHAIFLEKISHFWKRASCRAQARRQDLAAGGGKNQIEGPHFLNTVLDVCSNRGPNVKWGGTDFKWWGRAPLPPPRWRQALAVLT